MPTTYRIHPGIGIARLGNSPSEFCISPEEPAALPIECDSHGEPRLSPDGKSETRVKHFKDRQGRIKRQAARFQIYLYDEENPDGRPLKIGDRIKGGGNHGTLVDIHWRVYVANKKAVWYEFRQLEGEHGYPDTHPRRNASITNQDDRQRLIIDPGPRIINCTNHTRTQIDRSGDGVYAATFPPALEPKSVDSLGELLTDAHGRLLVLGGFGNSGSFKDGFGNPGINDYANNDGWFDDTSDGPVMARLVMYSEEVGAIRFIDVEYPAWVLVGYPAYVPPILDMVTLDDVIYNSAVRDFAWRRDIYTDPSMEDGFNSRERLEGETLQHWRSSNKQWNKEYKPWFYRDVWPILFRPDEFTYLCNVLGQSNAPHNKSKRGTFDPEILGAPPVLNLRALRELETEIIQQTKSGTLFVQSAEPQIWVLQARWEDDVRVAIVEAGLSDSDEAKAMKLVEQFFDEIDGILHSELEGFLKSKSADFVRAILPTPPGTFADYLDTWVAMAKEEPPVYVEARNTFKKTFDQALKTLESETEKSVQNVFYGKEFDELRTRLSAVCQNRLYRKFDGAIKRAAQDFFPGKTLILADEKARSEAVIDLYKDAREFLFQILRQPGEENRFQFSDKPNSRMHNLPLMPLLSGDNPISNVAASKFLRLTDYQLYVLRQWAAGKFYNEKIEGWAYPDPLNPYAGWTNPTGAALDRAVLMNLLGGAFCPGGEVCWIIRNPVIYKEPYRIKADPDFYTFNQTAASANFNSRGTIRPDELYNAATGNELSQDSDFKKGLQPGDLTKYSALPWQADFNECSTQMINVTYSEWNKIQPDSVNDTILMKEQKVWETLWWPAHRPMQTSEVVALSGGSPSYQTLDWSRGIPQTNAGDFAMVTRWADLGFVILNPYISEETARKPSVEGSVKYISVERTPVG